MNLRHLSDEKLKKTKRQSKKLWQACKLEEKRRKYKYIHKKGERF